MTVTGLFATPYRDALVLTQCAGSATSANDAIFAGFDAVAIQAARNADVQQGRTDPRCKMASGWEGSRQARLQVKFTF